MKIIQSSCERSSNVFSVICIICVFIHQVGVDSSLLASHISPYFAEKL